MTHKPNVSSADHYADPTLDAKSIRGWHTEAAETWSAAADALLDRRITDPRRPDEDKLELAYEIACITLTLAEQELLDQ